MIGTKTLTTIRKEIKKSLASDGGDPIDRLQRLIVAARGKGDRIEVLEGLKRFLEPTKRKPRRKRVGAKK
jgi:hypothetical protein